MHKDTGRPIILCALIFGLFFHFAPPAAEAEPVQWDSNGHWYDVVDASAINWLEANAVANTKQFNGFKGHLVTITSEAENQFLIDSFGADLGDRWIGGFQAEGAPEPNGGWTWITGEIWQFTNWSSGEPNNAGGNENALIFTIEPAWNDKDASDNAFWIPGYVIEYEPTLLERVKELESQVMNLEEKLENHRHIYRTGKRKGQKAITGTAIFPFIP